MKYVVCCSKCGRPLWNKESREKGIGPECERKLTGAPKKARRVKRMPGDTDKIIPYDGGSFWAERLEAPTIKVHRGHLALSAQTHEASGLKTNVPRLVYQHSQGFNFGYEGSGPAELALNLLLFVCEHTRDAERLHQAFKREFVARAKGNRFEIDRATLEAWLKAQGAPIENKT